VKKGVIPCLPELGSEKWVMFSLQQCKAHLPILLLDGHAASNPISASGTGTARPPPCLALQAPLYDRQQPLYLFNALLCDRFSIQVSFMEEVDIMSLSIGLIYQATTFVCTRYLLTAVSGL